MMGTRVKIEDGSTVDGYNIVLGGGVDDTQAIAREIWKSIPADEMPALIERLLVAYLRDRQHDETFAQFANRHSPDQLKALCTSAQTAA
jgi:ferredoxin-nitrite reductase